jgi:hypothetical protein
MINSWKPRLQTLYGLRNDIVHYGAAEKQDAAYADAVATVAFPFLTEFLQEAQGISVEKAITAAVFREMQVARQVCERLKAEGRDGSSWALKTVGHTMLYTSVDWPTPTDSAGWVRDDIEAVYEMANLVRKELSSAWEHFFICGCLEVPLCSRLATGRRRGRSREQALDRPAADQGERSALQVVDGRPGIDPHETINGGQEVFGGNRVSDDGRRDAI